MKREIEFRGLNANRQWVYGLISKDNAGDTLYYNEMPYRMCWFDNGAHCNQPIITDTIGQFIGLKDRNGVKIYEGDIIQSYDFNKEKYFIAKIEYKGSEFRTIVKGWETSSSVGSWCIPLEVIGNIYENSELI